MPELQPQTIKRSPRLRQFNLKTQPLYARILVQRKTDSGRFPSRPAWTHFDGFAAYPQAKGYARHTGCELLAKCCQFNGFLWSSALRAVISCAPLTSKLSWRLTTLICLTLFMAIPPDERCGVLNCLFDYLIQIKR
jgi:hypothetical protein